MTGQWMAAFVALSTTAAAAGCAMDTPGNADATETVATSQAAWTTSPYEYSTPWRGGSGGSTKIIGCPSGSVVVGVYGRSAVYVDEIGVVCAYLRNDGSLGAPFSPGGQVAGSQGGQPDKAAMCPSGQYAIAVEGASHTYLDYFGIVCTYNSETNLGGGLGGTPFYDSCPAGYAVIALDVHSGSWVDGELAICDRLAP